jgi:GST-like protein
MLEETGLPYTLHPVDILEGDQFDPEFLAISPNNKIPAIVDTDGPDGEPIAIFESGAILIYMAEKSGQFLPVNPRGRMRVLQWLMFQVGGVGPLFGQRNHFSFAIEEQIPYAIARYENEAKRMCRVLNKELAKSEYISGDYSIADIALFTWLFSYRESGADLNDFEHLGRWLDRVWQRPGVQRGLEVLADKRKKIEHSDKERDILFGETQLRQGSS